MRNNEMIDFLSPGTMKLFYEFLVAELSKNFSKIPQIILSYKTV